ncbi:hypothetical protein OEZ86_002272 [Tetradesmus obliquus]|nr:hypothetical protein OEZ86_002272 [Tetradesmus obliquus]
MDDMTLSVACGSPVANATQVELLAAYDYAANLPPAAIATDGTGLSSRPNARYKLWLDFKGSTITGTRWNELYCDNSETRQSSTYMYCNNPAPQGVGSSIVIPRYNEDADPNSFSTVELNNMEIIWRAVSEDYWPFDIDVTTNPPVGAQWTPQNYLRLVIGGNGAWVGGPGGISYGTAYWASISQWSKGEYPMASNLEDDMGRLSARIGWATGGTNGTAVPLLQFLGGGTSATVSSSVTAATLRNASDVHVYSFAAAPGTVTVTCDVLDAYNTIWQRSNINCQVRVLGQTGNVVGGAFNPNGTTTPTGLGTGQQTVTLTTGGT